MRLRATLIALVFVLAAALAGVTASSCGDDDESCNGRILSTCVDCTCPSGQTTTCTAYPKGDSNSNQRCCECN
jgi:hypothetical protein